jgi:MYXO-CTERM domain-containing protein
LRYFRNRSNTIWGKSIVALLSASLISASGIAQEPEPTTYTDLPVPQLTGWNDSNIFTTLDGITSATEKSYVYESVAAKELAEIEGNDREEGSVGAVYWQLDNESGRAPGIQVVTDDFDVPTNNCIMASGEAESVDFPGTIVPKTCSDPQGSSKRYFLEVTESDAPLDLVFDLGIKEIRYKGVKDPNEFGNEALDEFRATYGIGRIYRVIQKIINNTDTRIASYKFELGTGIGDAFQPLTFEEHGVAFEMRNLVPREFFEGETGAPDIEVWDPLRFATMSPKMYDDGARARFEPGFLDHAAAGFLPPQAPAEGVEKSQFIDSGLSIVDGVIGSLTPNYFDIGNTQGVVFPGNMLGYQLPDLLIPTVIAEYNTNEIGGESDAILAIWDGVEWRSGRAGLDGDPLTTADNYGAIPLDQLEQWAAKPLGLDIPGEAVEDIVRYDSILSDDLSGLNTDFFIYVGEQLLDGSGELTLGSITLRVTANSVTEVIGDVAGGEDPLWVQSGNEPPALASYMPATGTPVAINDIAITVATDPVTLNILGNDLLDGSPVVPGDGTITITTPPGDGGLVINGDNSITYTANEDFVGTELINYTVAVGGVTSNVATIRVSVDPAPIPDAPVANNDSAALFMNTQVTINVLANDELNNDAPGEVVVNINNPPLDGTARVDTNGDVIYIPNTGFFGNERFTYAISVDGKVSNSALITVRVDEPTVAPGTLVANDDSASTPRDTEVTIDVLANDELNTDEPVSVVVSIISAPLNGVASVNAGNSISYTPDGSFIGNDQLTYTVTVDGEVSNTAVISIMVETQVSSGSSGGGFCSAGSPGAPLDPMLPGMVLLAMAGLFMRRRKHAG